MTWILDRRLGFAALWLTCASPIACDGDTPEGSTDTDGADTDASGPTGNPTQDPTGDPTDDPTGDPTDDPTDDPTGDPTTGDTDTDTDTDTGDPGYDGVSLFNCGVELSCEQVWWHLEPEPPEATECIANLMAAQAPGAVSVLETLGPDVYEDEWLEIVRGDGTVIRQLRHRECEDCNKGSLPWEVQAPELCQVRIDVERYQGCLEGTYECMYSYALLDCEPYEEATCESVAADLAGEAPALVECGEASCPYGTVCVQEPDACECDPKTGENGYVPVAPTCHNAPEACGNDQDAWDAACLGALCESGGHELDGLEAGLLTCGEDAGDCFGPC